MKFATERPYADPEKAARKLIEIANSIEAVQDGRIYIELVNGPFLYEHKGTPAEYKAGLDLAIGRGWLVLHESGVNSTVSVDRGVIRAPWLRRIIWPLRSYSGHDERAPRSPRG